MTKGRKELRTFATLTEELVQRGEGLSRRGGTPGAIESTGVDGTPGFNLREGRQSGILVNARHSKAVPGRKPDVRDCEGLADLGRHGLFKARFIPPPEIGERRELVRSRPTGVREHTAGAKRIQKLSESANRKLGHGASEVGGAGGGCCAAPWRRAKTPPLRWRRGGRGSGRAKRQRCGGRWQDA